MLKLNISMNPFISSTYFSTVSILIAVNLLLSKPMETKIIEIKLYS